MSRFTRLICRLVGHQLDWQDFELVCVHCGVRAETVRERK